MSVARKKPTASEQDWACRHHPAFAAERELEARRQAEEPHWRRSRLTQFTLFAVVLILWPLPIINPVKLLVVLFHELSHVAAAYLTGGVVFGIAIDPGGAGATLGMGGNELLIVSMGYVGSLLIGLLLYVLIAAWEPGEVWLVLCILCGISPVFGWFNDFTNIFGAGTLIVMIACTFLLRPGGKKFILRWTAISCCLYPVIDVLSEVIWREANSLKVSNRTVASDVARLAQLTGLSAPLIAGVWMLAGLGVVWFMINWSARYEARGEVRRSLMRRQPPQDYIRALYAADPRNPPRYRVG